jgi:hypothetical protein
MAGRLQIHADRFFENMLPGFTMFNLGTSVVIGGCLFFVFASIRSLPRRRLGEGGSIRDLIREDLVTG